MQKLVLHDVGGDSTCTLYTILHVHYTQCLQGDMVHWVYFMHELPTITPVSSG